VTVQKGAKKERPGGQVKDAVNVCVADLFNHYGATEQAVCSKLKKQKLEVIESNLNKFSSVRFAHNYHELLYLLHYQHDGIGDSDFRVWNLNLPLKHNNSLVQSLAWTPHKSLYRKKALEKYQLVANMTDDSIRCIHFLQLKLVLKTIRLVLCI
jgi:hypothetical protein